MNRIKRAKTADRFMTIIFYCIAVFFFMFLAAFAGYVIIKGFAGADASMFKFSRRGSIGNQFLLVRLQESILQNMPRVE